MRTALFGFTTPNLGDDLQALAAALYLGRPDCYVDRDHLDQVRLDAPHRLCMNSWFAIKRWEAIPHESIEPTFFGFCMGRRELLNARWLGCLERHQPIGCRDEETVSWLQSAGIAAHMTGCITLWTGHKLAPVPAEARSGVYMVDVPQEMEWAIPAELRRRAVRLTNAPSEAVRWGGQKERFRQIARLCDLLRTAELVVTKRLHVMMPCVGFRTPVVGFVKMGGRGPKNWRFSGYESFVPMIVYDGSDRCPPFDWDNRTPAEIPDSLQARFVAFEREFADQTAPQRYASLSAAVEALIPDDAAIVRHPRQPRELIPGYGWIRGRGRNAA